MSPLSILGSPFALFHLQSSTWAPTVPVSSPTVAELNWVPSFKQCKLASQHSTCIAPSLQLHSNTKIEKDNKNHQSTYPYLSIPIHTSPPVTSESKVWSTRQQCTPMELWRSTARAKYDKMMRCLSTILHCELHCLSSCSPPPGLDDKIDIQGVRRQLRHFDEVWRRHGSSR